MEPRITGIHHITAIASDPQPNVDFYSGFLGLRLVKKTVNFDDPNTYHLYYGDYHGSPGSILTFFPWPGARRGRPGNGQVNATAFAVAKGSLDWWREQASKRKIATGPLATRFGQQVLSLQDHDGLPLELVETAQEGPESAVFGFHSATLAESEPDRTARLLTGTMGLRLIGQEDNRYRYQAEGEGFASLVDVVHSPGAPRGLSGAGTVHHIAWRTPDDAHQSAWRAKLLLEHYNVSPVMDRNYFHSIYYREPGGILFEIATDPPGFAVDEPLESLGSELKLPVWYEPDREAIERSLPVLETPIPA